MAQYLRHYSEKEFHSQENVMMGLVVPLEFVDLVTPELVVLMVITELVMLASV